MENKETGEQVEDNDFARMELRKLNNPRRDLGYEHSWFAMKIGELEARILKLEAEAKDGK